MDETVARETMQAYADAWMDAPFGKVSDLRNLNYRARNSVSVEDARIILGMAIAHGYNEFSADLLDKFPCTAQITIAREGSVCLYVKGSNLPSQEALLADEYTQSNGETRIWWD